MTRLALLVLAIVLPSLAGRAAQATPPLVLDLSDYLALPITGKLDGTGQTDGILARVNSFREEPGGSGRVFVHDLTGPLYILDKQSKSLTTYLNFNGRPLVRQGGEPASGQPGNLPQTRVGDRLGRRPDHVPVRSGVPLERPLLHGAPRGSGGGRAGGS